MRNNENTGDLVAAKAAMKQCVAGLDKRQISATIHEFCSKYNRHQITVQAYIKGAETATNIMLYETLISFFKNKTKQNNGKSN